MHGQAHITWYDIVHIRSDLRFSINVFCDTHYPGAQILMETSKRQGKKMTTSVSGLEHFGIKLAEASKVFGKKVNT